MKRESKNQGLRSLEGVNFIQIKHARKNHNEICVRSQKIYLFSRNLRLPPPSFCINQPLPHHTFHVTIMNPLQPINKPFHETMWTKRLTSSKIIAKQASPNASRQFCTIPQTNWIFLPKKREQSKQQNGNNSGQCDVN